MTNDNLLLLTAALSTLRGLEPADWRQVLLKAWPDMPEETLADVAVKAKKILDKNMKELDRN